MYIYISFFQITRHIIYGTLHILAFPFFKYSSWFNIWRSKYRHFSPPSLTHSLLEAEPHTHKHTQTHTHTQTRTHSSARLDSLYGHHWLLLTENIKQHYYVVTFIQWTGWCSQHDCHWKSAKAKLLCVALPKIQRTNTKKISSWDKTPE